ncbi:hypothetical protein VE03_10894 [Pseudogymnoascus sp. 23342-1-I1]|nr:hypothetical protein VE03_10894 [Pseudogymnoascus sp. 23342-1-I1]
MTSNASNATKTGAAFGRCRPQIININDLGVQLPCSEEDFQFGINVKTGSLKDSAWSRDGHDGSTTITSTRVLSIYIRLVALAAVFDQQLPTSAALGGGAA